MSSHTIIGKLYDRLASKTRQLDERLLEEFEPTFSNIDKLRYDFFRKCVEERHDSKACFEQAERFELRPGFAQAGKALQECINKAAGSNAWEKAGDACVEAYEKTLRRDIQAQINRVLRSV